MTPEEARQKAAELVADNQLDFTEVVAEWLMLQQKEPGKVKAVFSVDWSLLRATQDSLREHMALLRAAQEREQRFRAEVAAALGELQSVWHRRMNSAEDKVMESALRDVLDELNAAARALGIQEAGE